MEYSKNFNFALPSSANDVDLADINEIANNFRKVDEQATKKEFFEKIQSEVVDARKDFVGRENKSVGESVRNQFGELFDVVGTGKNLFNPNDPDIVVGKIFDAGGNLSVANAAFLTSGYIPVEEGENYYSSVLRNGVRNVVVRTHAFYDENKALISASNTALTTMITIPTEQNIKYIRISTYSESGGGSECQFERDVQTDYEPYHLLYALRKNVAKSSLKTPIENNEALVKTSSSLNLVNKDELLVGKFDDNTALLDNNASFVSTKPIYIKGYDRIVFQAYTIDVIIPRASLFYDENMELIAHYSIVYDNMQSAEAYPDTCWQSLLRDRTTDGNVYVIPVPENACYYACSARDTHKDTLMVYGLKGEKVEYVYPVPYQPYVEAYRLKQDILPIERYIKSYFNGKKLVAIGDSITYGTHDAGRLTEWGKRVATMLNMTFVNYGIGGSEIAINKANSPYNPMCVRYAEMDDDADLIIVAGGTNDWGHITGSPSVANGEYLMGEFGDTEPTTFYGALDTMCKGLLAKYVGKTIVFMTPIKRYSALSTPYYNENYRGYTLEDYVNAIKKVCGHYGIPVLDMFNECSLNPIIEPIKTAYIEDGTHPNSAGHMIMARQIAGFISSLKNDIDYN